MENYRHEITGDVISSHTYRALPSYEQVKYRRFDDNDDDISITDVALGIGIGSILSDVFDGDSSSSFGSSDSSSDFGGFDGGDFGGGGAGSDW